jgi:hypothetical protein
MWRFRKAAVVIRLAECKEFVCRRQIIRLFKAGRWLETAAEGILDGNKQTLNY